MNAFLVLVFKFFSFILLGWDFVGFFFSVQSHGPKKNWRSKVDHEAVLTTLGLLLWVSRSAMVVKSLESG